MFSSLISNRTRLAQLGLVFTTLAWGATFVLVKEGLNHAQPFTFSAYRFLIATICTTLLVRSQIFQLNKQEFYSAVLCGFFLFAGYAFQNFGLMETTPSKSAFITSVSVIMVPVILVLFRLQKINIRMWVATLLAIIGLYILLDPAGKGLNIGDILTFGCALSFAIHVITQDIYLKKGANIAHFFLCQVMFVALFSLFGVIIFEGPYIYPSEQLLVAVIVTGVLATFVAFLLMIWAQTLLSANQTAILLSLEPVFAALFSTFFAGELLGLYGWVGGSIVVLGVISSGIKKTKK